MSHEITPGTNTAFYWACLWLAMQLSFNLGQSLVFRARRSDRLELWTKTEKTQVEISTYP